MMDTIRREDFKTFEKRINTFAFDGLHSRNNFHVNPNSYDKIDEYGSFKKYIRNAVVFELPEEVKDYAGKIQSMLYEVSPEIFAEKLVKENFHITLHDLLGGPHNELLLKSIMLMSIDARKFIDEIRMNKQVLRFGVVSLMNMVNSSMVLVVMPSDVETYNTMMRLYRRFDYLVQLEYMVTPHITLAYFKPGTYGENVLNPLADFIDEVNSGDKCEFTVDTDMLMYHMFEYMHRVQRIYR